MCFYSGNVALAMKIPDEQWTPSMFSSFKGVLGKVEEFDKIAGQPDCVDPEKDAWMKRIEERLMKLEAAAFRSIP
jgi:hypothetical protein